MGMRRDPSTGELVDDSSRVVSDQRAPNRDTAGAPTELVESARPRPAASPGRAAGGAAPTPGAGRSAFEAETVKMGAAQRPGEREPDEQRTRLHRPGIGTADTVPVKPAADAPMAGTTPVRPVAGDPMADPVVGWLVVVTGPGKGEVCPLGYGMNTLGRAESSRVRLDFGDGLISREGHATLTYDPRGRKFYLQHGGGTNLIYLGDEPVLVPTILGAMQDFSIGETTVRFVPFCGPDFDWQDVADD